jgi:phasin family protein
MADQIGAGPVLGTVGEMIAIHLRNVEALAKAQQSFIEGQGLVLQQQLECFRAAMDQAGKSARDMLSDPDPRSNACRRFDLVKACLKQNTCDAGMLAELSAKFSGEASHIIQERLYQSLDEAKAVVSRLFDEGVGVAVRAKAA